MPVGFPDYYGGLTLPVTVAEGGTGQTSVTAGAILYGAGSSALIVSNVGTTNQVLQVNSVSLVPTFQSLVISASELTGILPIANGGTGSGAPALIAGSNIVLSGSWPNNTIAVAASPTFSGLTVNVTAAGQAVFSNSTSETEETGYALAVDNAGAGANPTTSIALTLKGTPIGYIWAETGGTVGIDPTGTGRLVLSEGGGTGGVEIYNGSGSKIADFTSTGIAFSQPLTLTTPLAVAQGGSGSTSPALVAGSNIVLSGSWPDQTVAVSATPSFTTTDVSPSSTGTGLKLHGNTTTPISPALLLYDDTGAKNRGVLGLSEATGNFSSGSVAGDIVLRADTGTLRLSTASVDALTISQSQIVSLANPLPVTSGGSGSTSPALVAGSNIVLSGSWPNETVALASSISLSISSRTAINITSVLGGITIGAPGSTDEGAVLISNASTASGATKQTQLGAGTESVAGINNSLFGLADSGVAWRVAFDLSGNLGLAGNLNIGGLVGSYNGLTPTGQGVPVIVTHAEATGVTSGGTVATGPAVAGVYRVSWMVDNTAGVGSFTLAVNFTPPGGTSTNTNLATTGPVAIGSGLIYANATAITLSLALGSGATVDYAVTIERMV